MALLSNRLANKVVAKNAAVKDKVPPSKAGRWLVSRRGIVIEEEEDDDFVVVVVVVVVDDDDGEGV